MLRFHSHIGRLWICEIRPAIRSAPCPGSWMQGSHLYKISRYVVFESATREANVPRVKSILRFAKQP
jgi:hypothetical protein